MAEHRGSMDRRLEPIVNMKGHIISWKCSSCRWSASVADDSTGLFPSRTTVALFGKHDCSDHSTAQDRGCMEAGLRNTPRRSL